jgi:hypothetical protein
LSNFSYRNYRKQKNYPSDADRFREEGSILSL